MHHQRKKIIPFSVLLSHRMPQESVSTVIIARPCPEELDVGLINKYYDLAKAGDALAKSHYENLAVKADSCIRCGHCNKRCPFHVDQMARMQEIDDWF